jgi:xanthine dehydrogenase accessory factor
VSVRELLDEALGLLGRREPFALVTLVSRQGSAPRATGARMLVRADGAITGSVGGGLLEATAVREAVAAVAGKVSRVIAVGLGGTSVDEARMLCGGDTELLIACVPAGDPQLTAVLEALRGAVAAGRRARLLTFFAAEPGPTGVDYCLLPDGGQTVGALPLPAGELLGLSGETVRHGGALLPDGRRLTVEDVEPPVTVLVCGAGHVGQALAPAAAAAGFRVVVLDDRPEFAAAGRLPAADRVVVLESFERAFAGVDVTPRTFVVIVTRGHAHDYTVLRQALRSPAGYVGLMGSASKRAKLFAALRSDGFSEEELARVHSPIGLAIGAETPAELAVSITAELIQVRAGLRP